MDLVACLLAWIRFKLLLACWSINVVRSNKKEMQDEKEDFFFSWGKNLAKYVLKW